MKSDDRNAYAARQAAVKGADPRALRTAKGIGDRPAYTNSRRRNKSVEKTIRDHANAVFTKATAHQSASRAKRRRQTAGRAAGQGPTRSSSRHGPGSTRFRGTMIFQESLQNAFMSKREQRNAATQRSASSSRRTKRKRRRRRHTAPTRPQRRLAGNRRIRRGRRHEGGRRRARRGSEADHAPPQLAAATAHAPQPTPTRNLPEPAGHDAHGAPGADAHHSDKSRAPAVIWRRWARPCLGCRQGSQKGREARQGREARRARRSPRAGAEKEGA